MLKKFLIGASALCFTAALAYAANNIAIDGNLTVGGTSTLTGAQTFTGNATFNGTASFPGTVTGATTYVGASTFSSAINANAHVNTNATPPVLTSCGTSPSITGSDTAGIVTMGTTATGCVITFATAYTGTPFCVVSWIATPLASQSYVTSNTAITLTQTSTSNNKVQYVCMGPSGG